MTIDETERNIAIEAALNFMLALKVSENAERKELLKEINTPEFHKLVLEEILRDPSSIFNFHQHEIPEEWIAKAIQKDPLLLGEMYHWSFTITDKLSEIFKSNGLYIKHVDNNKDCPYLAYKYAIDENIYAILYTPDDFLIRYLEENFKANTA